MAGVLLLFELLTTLTIAIQLVEGEKECPPFFEWMNTSDSSGYCACAEELPPGSIQCEQRHQVSLLLQGFCTFYDSEEDIIRVSKCPFVFPESMTKNAKFVLPSNVSELNSVVCRSLSREVKGPLCGRCINNTGPSIYSVGVECVSCSPMNILYYILLQYLPSTLMFLLVIVFRPNITSSPMAMYVLFCNCTVLYCRLSVWFYAQRYSAITNLFRTATTLSAVWSFDALLFISPPLCISSSIKEFQIPFLEFLATIFPFLLLLLSYTLIEMHAKNFRPLVILWRWFSRVYVNFYRAWNPTSSMIQAFASLFFLSYAKLSYLVWETLEWSEVKTKNGKEKRFMFYIDPNVPFLSTTHVLLMTFSLAVAMFVFLPPLLILVVYPTSLYRKISHCISPKWKLRIKTYVENFHGSFKDGTNGNKDYRLLSGWLIFLCGWFPLLLFGTVMIINDNFFIASYAITICFCAAAFLCILLQPYKETLANHLTAALLVNLGLFAAIGTHDNKSAEVLMAISMLVPHSIMWGYVTWRLIKIAAPRCVWCCIKYDDQQQRLLILSAEGKDRTATNCLN